MQREQGALTDPTLSPTRELCLFGITTILNVFSASLVLVRMLVVSV